MSRPRSPTPLFWHLHFNPISGFYEIHEEGITYKMQLDETRSLNDFFRDFITVGGVHYPSVAGWFNDLANGIKKNVISKGYLKLSVNNGFYPDSNYD